MVIKRRGSDVQQVKRVRKRDFLFDIQFSDFDKHFGILFLGSAKADSALFGKRDTFGLTGANVLSFVLGDKREKLQNYVGYKSAYQVVGFISCVEQGAYPRLVYRRQFVW